jgi:F0F1-type ATP synthase assembly protein I
MSSQKNNNAIRYAGLTTQMMGMLLLGVWVGRKIDVWLGWKFPLFLILLPLLALVISLWMLIKEFNKPSK